MLFVPTGTLGLIDAVRVFVFTFNERMRVKAWSEYVGWEWKAARSSALGRVFLTKDTRIYQYGNEAFSEEFSADFLDIEYDGSWVNNTAYVIGDRELDPDLNTVWICLMHIHLLLQEHSRPIVLLDLLYGKNMKERT